MLVSVFDLFAHPVLEGLIDDRCTDVDYPLLGRLRNVYVVGEESLNVGDISNELQDLLE